MIKEEYKYSELTAKIIGCAMEVHKVLGFGFPEKIYQRALEIEMQKQHLNFQREKEVVIYYKEDIIGKRRVDFLVEDVISVETKAIAKLEDKELNQGLNYLTAYKFEIGLLLNFGASSLEFKRLINSNYNK
jgi:GxxExxY protein